jgi:rhomboid protease GluP
MHQQQRLSILCPRCRKLISRDVSQCPYCGTTKPGSLLKNNLWVRGMAQEDQLLRTILYTNIAMFILSLIMNPRLSTFSLNPLYLLSPDNKSLFLLGATGAVPVLGLGRWWTLVAANYLHGGILHIVFNMIALRQLAPLVVMEYGNYRMFVIYTVSGVLGYLVSCLAGVSFTIGASASVCGLMGAALYFGRSRGGVFGRAVYSQIIGWAVTLFAFGFIVPGINNWGHGGGILSGVALGFLLGYRGQRPEGQGHRVLAAACMVITAVVLLWSVSSTLFMLLLS